MRTAAKRELQRAESPLVTGVGAALVAVDPSIMAVLKAGFDGDLEVASHFHL